MPKKPPKLTRRIIKRNKKYRWGIKSLAGDFETDSSRLIGDVNKLVKLVNSTLLKKNGRVYTREFEGTIETPVDYVGDILGLVDLAARAYGSVDERSQYALYIFDGKKERRWYPSHIVSYEELEKT